MKGRAYINSPTKYCYEGMGLRNARLNLRQAEENRLMENGIYNELVARGYSVDVGVVDIYGRNSAGKTERVRLEVDFVATGARIEAMPSYRFLRSTEERIIGSMIG